ncbi:helix-turn-helix transcriptional regulator [Reichenbachiella agarivorans]|uniref:Helix-turn-helix transcriptional regulator n=1 Tax=Reichenbachiella agarivorans TaxID=2979464 RepID=A0ABY6CQP6_9BACT|nr:helix-turn-helix transcriptional regulator [Reichenbachiella agarivorans]UXP32842.1 helix-turn-helix transcriptional regulator [Reichenbachiella agarivorans]
MNNIPNISFDSSEKTTDIEFLRISELFERVEENPNHDPLKPHRITFFALLIVTEGEGMHQVDLENYLLKKGSVLKIAKGQVHAFQENLSYDGYLVVFTEDFVLKFFSKSTIDFISHLYNYHISDPMVEGSNFNESFLALIAQELNYENTYAQRNIIAKMLELYLLKLERVSHLAISTKRNTEQYPLFFQFKNLVEERYMDTRNVKDYAEYMSVSAKQLNAVVQNFTLNTAKHFIDEYVVLEIKRAILSTNNSLKEIAYELGFDQYNPTS